jgi:hypothetical protein
MIENDNSVAELIRAKLGNKRKAVKPTRDMVAPIASIEPLTIEAMVLKAEGRTKAHFKRLKYNGCPNLSKQGEFAISTVCIDMKRDDFVRDMYRLFKPDFNVTSRTRFDELCVYIRWLDDKGHLAIEEGYFHNDLIKLYMEGWRDRVSLNKAAPASMNNAKQMLNFILKAKGRYADAKRLPPVIGAAKSTKSYKAIHVESELKPTVKILFRGFKGLAIHLEKNTTPKISPMWDDVLFNDSVKKCGWSTQQKRYKAASFKKCLAGDWRNQLTRIAAMICFMFTGMNTTPMLNMKRRDVYFKQIQGGKYVFDAIKGRSNYREIDNGIGFSKYAREFIESWLLVSSKITGADLDAPLFPFVTSKGEVTTFIAVTKHPQTAVNKLLDYLGLTKITPSILRKTKLDTLMKVTEDIYLVSISGNNNVNTIKQSYSAGLEQDHQRNLAASTEAMFNIAKGKPIAEAVGEAKHAYHDVLSEYDYKRLREKEQNDNEALTPLGVRCQNNKKGATERIDKILKKRGIKMPEEEKRCTSFLECFECEHHKLVAAVDDIWLMLSFKDTLQDMQAYPSINSLPEDEYKNLCLTIDSILERFKEVDKANYSEALEKIKSACHPLYSTAYSLNDLLEVFS